MGNDVWDSFMVDNVDSLTRRKFSKIMQRNQKDSIVSADTAASLKYDEKINIDVFGNPIVRQEDAEILGAVYASVKWKRILDGFNDDIDRSESTFVPNIISDLQSFKNSSKLNDMFLLKLGADARNQILTSQDDLSRLNGVGLFKRYLQNHNEVKLVNDYFRAPDVEEELSFIIDAEPSFFDIYDNSDHPVMLGEENEINEKVYSGYVESVFVSGGDYIEDEDDDEYEEDLEEEDDDKDSDTNDDG